LADNEIQLIFMSHSRLCQCDLQKSVDFVIHLWVA